jgi:hypothetical protein
MMLREDGTAARLDNQTGSVRAHSAGRAACGSSDESWR